MLLPLVLVRHPVFLAALFYMFTGQTLLHADTSDNAASEQQLLMIAQVGRGGGPSLRGSCNR